MVEVVRRSEAMTMVGLRRSAFDQLRHDDPSFPKPAFVNRTPIWRRDEVEAWIEAKFAAR